MYSLLKKLAAEDQIKCLGDCIGKTFECISGEERLIGEKWTITSFDHEYVESEPRGFGFVNRISIKNNCLIYEHLPKNNVWKLCVTPQTTNTNS